MKKLQLLFHYYRSIHAFNMPFSLLVGLLCIAVSTNKVAGLINGFSLCLVTGGFAIAIYLYEQRHSQQYYFYHNQGLSRLHLIAGTLSVNLMLVILLFLFKILMLRG